MMSLPILDLPKFECSACGTCCSNIQGFVSESEKEFLREFGYGKLPLIQLVPVEESTFPVWDFEAKEFREFEKKVDIDAGIRPLRGVFDLKSNKFIVVAYQLTANNKRCPFLAENNKCSIYDTRRGLICHLFPFNKSPFLDIGKEDFSSLFGSCKKIKDIVPRLDFSDKKKLMSQLKYSFGETFFASVEHDYIMEWSNKLIIDLMKEKIIKPALNYPYEFLKKRIVNSDHVDLMDFLVESGYKSKEEVEELVDNFHNRFHAKRRVDDFLEEKNT